MNLRYANSQSHCFTLLPELRSAQYIKERIMETHEIIARPSVDFMLRSAQQHHIQLSAMADQKANIVIAFSSIVFTVSLGNIEQLSKSWGFVALASFSLIALVYAILSVVPMVERKGKQSTFTFNPLFFGHFTELDMDDYVTRMKEIIRDDEEVYETLIRDIYQIGDVLKKKKYRYLKISYRLFLLGLFLSAIVFVVQFVLQ